MRFVDQVPIYVIEDMIGMGYYDGVESFRGIIFAQKYYTAQEAWNEIQINKHIKPGHYTVKSILEVK
jgi:hypothetical protein